MSTYPGIRAPTHDLKQHTELLKGVKEALEIAQRVRGDARKSFVRLEELIELGLADQYGNLFPPATTGVGLTDHGGLSGLTDDDHPQYAALAQNETVTGSWIFRWADPVYSAIEMQAEGVGAYAEFRLKSAGDQYSGGFNFYSSRGTVAAPTQSLPGDLIGELSWGPHTATGGYQFTSRVGYYVTNVAGTNVQGYITLMNGETFATMQERLSVDHTGRVFLGTDGYLDFDEHSSAPGTPAAGRAALYAKADGRFYSKDDAGTEYAYAAKGETESITGVWTFDNAGGAPLSYSPVFNDYPKFLFGFEAQGAYMELNTQAGGPAFTSFYIGNYAHGLNNKWWLMEIEDETHFRHALVNDALGTYKNVLRFTRNQAVVTLLDYGNSTDYPSHTFYGYMSGDTGASGGGMDLSGTGVGLYLQDKGAATNEKWWALENYSATGDLHLFAANDAFSTKKTAWKGVRGTGAVIASIEYGNATDNPPHRFFGKHLLDDGSASLPIVTFNSDPDTGMYRTAADTLSFAAGATETLRLTAGLLSLRGHTTTATAPGAGGAGALPATPAGYVTVDINGTNQQIAYY